MSKSARKSPETDKKGKAIEAYHRKQEEQLCPNPSTTPPESIRACPALRAPRLEPHATPAHGTSPETGWRKDGQTAPTPKSLRAWMDELIDAGLSFAG
jgi:hypothetical protein